MINIIKTEISFLCKMFLLVEIGLVSIAPCEMKIKFVIIFPTINKKQKAPERKFQGFMVGVTGLEPTTSCSLSKHSSHLSYTPMSIVKGKIGRSGGTRTHGLLLPKQALYHLSHTPIGDFHSQANKYYYNDINYASEKSNLLQNN